MMTEVDGMAEFLNENLSPKNKNDLASASSEINTEQKETGSDDFSTISSFNSKFSSQSNESKKLDYLIETVK